MIGRPPETPKNLHEMLFFIPGVYVTAVTKRLTPTVTYCARGVAFLLALSSGVAATPVYAADLPGPTSRPTASRIEQGAAAARGPAARLSPRLAYRLQVLGSMLAKAGVDVDQLVAANVPGTVLSEGQGGPLLPAVSRGAGRAAERASAAEFERLRRAQNLLLAMPVAAPMVEYKFNSGFGYRSDPFRHRGAMHTGLDLGGPHYAPIFATAPGTVIEAGRSGAYGIMVVIDHGMGIETRYAHLSRALVQVGGKVGQGQNIGIMGATGRATGPHLHYEIRLDGRPLDPKPFLEAGIQLAAN